MEDTKRIRVFDTTLRDGQQCPGAAMSFEKNLEYARLAMEVGVDVLEAGFPSASNLDFEIVKTIAGMSSLEKCPFIAGLCQLREAQIDRTIEALMPAVEHGKALLHTYVPVSAALSQASLGARADDRKQIRDDVFNFIKRAVDAGCQVEFSPEGYSRVADNFDYCTDLIRAAVEAGALVINCPDTIGGSCDLEGDDYFVENMKRHASIIAREYPNRAIIWSAHCHNDFGLAVQNTINAVFHGPVRQIEGCFNGIGERAGNAALEQCIMIIKHFGDCQKGGSPFFTNVRTEKLAKICEFVSRNMLISQPHWPIVGQNAARHSAGGHTNAILRDPLAYQPFDPREVGKKLSFLFGPLSGGNHAKRIITEHGYVCEDPEKAEIAQFIKDLYKERRKGITDEELLKGYFRYRSPIRIDHYEYSKSSNMSSVKLTGRLFDTEGEVTATHAGRDSALAALKKIVDPSFGPLNIQSHSSHSDREGIDAASISTIIISDELGNVFEGRAEDQDIEISALKAFVEAVNTAFIERRFRLQRGVAQAHTV